MAQATSVTTPIRELMSRRRLSESTSLVWRAYSLDNAFQDLWAHTVSAICNAAEVVWEDESGRVA